MSQHIGLPIMNPRVVNRKPAQVPSSVLGRLNSFLKQHKVISSGLNYFGHPKLASLASVWGYGKKKGARRGGARARPKAVKF